MANAGADRIAFVGVPLPLQGFASYTNTIPTTILWKRYSGPTNVTFASTSLTNTTVTFGAPGVYTLMLSASNGVHAIAYDAVVVTVSQQLLVSLTKSGNTLNLTWSGGTAPFVVERTTNFPAINWSSVLTTSVQNASFPITPGQAFFRLRGN